MFEHPESLARVMQERYEERAAKGAARQAVRAELGLGWRCSVAGLLRDAADWLERTSRYEGVRNRALERPARSGGPGLRG